MGATLQQEIAEFERRLVATYSVPPLNAKPFTEEQPQAWMDEHPAPYGRVIVAQRGRSFRAWLRHRLGLRP